MMAAPAPVVIFAYRRPEHLRRTLQSLVQCSGFENSPLILYGDGPKDEGEQPGIEATRRVAQEILGDRAEYRFSDVNLGLSQSVIRGVTEASNRFGRVIVLEDDLEVAPDFLVYMNAALNRYAGDPSVFQISGYMFDVPEFARRRAAVFLPLTVSWGWATWKRAWDRFDPGATGWERLLADEKLRRKFDLAGTYGYSTMLVRQMTGLGDSWAVRWYWTAFINDGLTVFPPASRVRNTGFDGSGTHGSGILRSFAAKPLEWSATECNLPDSARVDAHDLATVKKALWRTNGRWYGAAVDRMRWIATKWMGSR
jgi:hypothetical protein